MSYEEKTTTQVTRAYRIILPREMRGQRRAGGAVDSVLRLDLTLRETTGVRAGRVRYTRG